MVVLDDDGTSSGDSSSTLMDSFSRKGKSRVLQIGDYLDDVGEDEIDSVIEITKGGRINLNFSGTNLAKNSNAYGRSSDGELVGAG